MKDEAGDGERKRAMNCRKARKSIPLHVGGDAAVLDRELDEHLARCPECRREFDVLNGLRKALVRAGLGPAPVSDSSFLEGVRARIRQGVRPASPAPERFAARALSGLVAGAAVAALVGVILWAAPGRDARVLPGPDPVPSEAEVGSPAVVTPSLPIPPAGAPVVFDLAGTGLVGSGGGHIAEAEIVPDPGRDSGSAASDFPLFEMKPIDEAEICADF